MRHRTDPVALVFGLFFLAAAGWYVLSEIVVFRFFRSDLVLAGGLVLLGIAGVTAGLLVELRRRRAGDPPADDPDGQLSA